MGFYFGEVTIIGALTPINRIGPIKYGENKTGHPPGDNWLLYPKFGQLVPGIGYDL